MEKKNKTSPIWEFFTEINEGFAVCNICKTKLSFKSSISNLKRHVGSKHPTIKMPKVMQEVKTTNIY